MRDEAPNDPPTIPPSPPTPPTPATPATGGSSMRFGVVDVETSGLSVRRHRILQLGLVVVDGGGRVVEQWSSLVRVRWPWQRLGPRRVHGLRRRDLRDATPLAEALTELSTRLDGAVFTAHNARFDGAFLERAARRSGVPLDLGPRLCTLRMSRRLDPERRRSHRLTDLCARYDVRLDRPHDALHDAAATAAVLPHLLAAHGISRPADLEPFLDRTRAAPRRRPLARVRRRRRGTQPPSVARSAPTGSPSSAAPFAS